MNHTRQITRLITWLLIFFLRSLTTLAQSASSWQTKTDAFITSIMRDWQVPGLAIAVISGEQVVYTKGYGLRNVESRLPVTLKTQFPVASVTKPFTGLALAHLQETRSISLREPVQTYWPSFRLIDRDRSAQCTIIDLLTHRTGLPSHDAMWWGASVSRQQLVARMQYLPVNLSFREVWQYSNLSYVAAGYILEQITGSTWEAYVRQHLLTPLAMPSVTCSLADLRKQENVALPYRVERDTLKQIPYIDLTAVAPCGGLNANVEEMSHFVVMQLNEGRYNNQQIVSKAALAYSHTPVVVMPPHRNQEGIHYSYALGWVSGAYGPHKLLECGGQIDGFNSIISLLPNQKIGVVILSNSDNVQPTGLIKNYVLNQLAKLPDDSTHVKQLASYRQSMRNYKEGNPLADPDRKLGTSPSQPLTAFAGQYDHPGYGTVRIEIRQNQLYGHFNGYESLLNHFNYDTFVTQKRIPFFKQGFQFGTNFDGLIDRVEIRLEPKVAPILFVRQANK